MSRWIRVGAALAAVAATFAAVGAAATPAPPRNTSLPTISGTTRVGETLTGR